MAARPSQTMRLGNEGQRLSWTVDMQRDGPPDQMYVSGPIRPLFPGGQEFTNAAPNPVEIPRRPVTVTVEAQRASPAVETVRPLPVEQPRRSLPDDAPPRLPFQPKPKVASNCPFKVSIEQIYDDDPDYFRAPALAGSCCPKNASQPQQQQSRPRTQGDDRRTSLALAECLARKDQGDPFSRLNGMSRQELKDLQASISGLLSPPQSKSRIRQKRDSYRDDDEDFVPERDRDRGKSDKKKSNLKDKSFIKGKSGGKSKSKIIRTKSKTATRATKKKSPQKRRKGKEYEPEPDPEPEDLGWGSPRNSKGVSLSEILNYKPNSRSGSIRDQYDDAKRNSRSGSLKNRDYSNARPATAAAASCQPVKDLFITVTVTPPEEDGKPNKAGASTATRPPYFNAADPQPTTNLAGTATANRAGSFSAGNNEPRPDSFATSQSAVASNIRGLEQNLNQITREYSDLKTEFDIQKGLMASVKAERDKNSQAVEELSRVIASNESAQHSLLAVIQDMKIKMESLERRGLLTPTTPSPYSTDKPFSRPYGSTDQGQGGPATSGGPRKASGEQRFSIGSNAGAGKLPNAGQVCVPGDSAAAAIIKSMSPGERSMSRDAGPPLKDNCTTYNAVHEGTTPYEPDKQPKRTSVASSTKSAATKAKAATTGRKPGAGTKPPNSKINKLRKK